MNLLHIARKELLDYLSSSMFYILLGIFLALIGFMHWSGVRAFAEYSAQAAMSGGMDFSLNDLVQNLYEQSEIILTFLIPLMTMRLFSEEQKSHTLEFLLSSPASTWDIVLGKFLAALAVFMLMIGATALFPAELALMADMDWGPLATTYLGFLLLGAGFISLGMFFSSLTESQMIAALFGFGGLLLLFLLSWISSTGGDGGLGFGVGYFSVLERMGAFTKGLIRSQDLVYWITFTGLFLLATHQRVESLRYR